MLKKLLHRFGLIDSSRLDARDGRHKNVFCPHCGAFIPSKYRVFQDGMTFDCPDCDRSGAVFDVVDVDPPVSLTEPIMPERYSSFLSDDEGEVDGE